MCILGKSKDFKYVALGGNFQAEAEFNFPSSQSFIKKQKKNPFLRVSERLAEVENH